MTMHADLRAAGTRPGARRRLLVGPLGPSLVEAAGRWCRALGDEAGLDAQDRYRLELCVEELSTNLVKYSGEACVGSRVELQASFEAQRLQLRCVDRCAPFDPLAAPPPQAAQRLDELKVGGQGLHLLRTFSDACRYAHRDGCNRLTLVFELAQPPAIDLGLAPAALAATAPIFRGVPEGTLEPLLAGLPVLDVFAELRLLQRGDANHAVLLVLQGMLHVYLDQPGAEDFLEVAAGECVGEMSVIDEQPVSAHVFATAGTRLLLIDGRSFLERLLAVPRVARNLMSAMAERMRRSDRLSIRRTRQLLALEQTRRELAFAHDIQASLLPAEPLLAGDARLDCVGRMRPARDVGGDFYDLFFLDHRHLLFVIADVCGKGLPAALFMVRAIAALRAQPRQAVQAELLLPALVSSLNEQLIAYNAARQFITAFCGVLDLQSHRLQYVNAGHNPPLVAPAGQPFAYLQEPISPLVGMVPGLRYRGGELQLAPGSTLLLYTDGVTEAEDAGRRMFGEVRLLQGLQPLARASASRLVDAVFAEVDAFAGGAPQSDDITVLAIRSTGR
jgi:sigma-B regulation protein RsbU (phosphoserine phosphatase)